VPLDYAKAGVDLSKHREMHRVAAEAIARVAEELGANVGGLGGFAPYIRLGDLDLALHVDGVGTKTLVLKELGAPEVAGWDCVAMNVNDLACGGFRVVATSDYVAMGEPNVELFRRVVSGMASAARYVRAPIVSGETAIPPGLVRGLDVVCFAVGTRGLDWVDAPRWEKSL
jgi:phosphoribosylformylglycinamidine cyclo-ligase